MNQIGAFLKSSLHLDIRAVAIGDGVDGQERQGSWGRAKRGTGEGVSGHEKLPIGGQGMTR